jgi:hypothetical protein
MTVLSLMQLFLRPDARYASSRTRNARRRQFHAGDFLDLPRGARSVIDHDALAQSEIDDVLLARDLFGRRGCGKHEEGKASE